MFISWYFNNFHDRDPFGFGGEDINSIFKGLKRNLDAHLSELNIRPIEMPHNALEDAIIQAKEFEKILEAMKNNYQAKMLHHGLSTFTISPFSAFKCVVIGTLTGKMKSILASLVPLIS